MLYNFIQILVGIIFIMTAVLLAAWFEAKEDLKYAIFTICLPSIMTIAAVAFALTFVWAGGWFG